MLSLFSVFVTTTIDASMAYDSFLSAFIEKSHANTARLENVYSY